MIREHMDSGDHSFTFLLIKIVNKSVFELVLYARILNMMQC